MRSALLLLSAAIAVSACSADVPMAPATADAAGKQFGAPAAGKSALYLYREGRLNSAFVFNMSIGRGGVGTLGADTWLRVDLDPGTYDVRCAGENTVSRDVTLAPGETRFVEAQVRIGWSSARCVLIETTAAQAKPAITSGRRGAEIR